MISPLVKNACGELVDKRADAVLGYNRCAAFADQLINAVIDLLIKMIRSAAKNDNGFIVFFSFLKILQALVMDFLHVVMIFVIGLIGSVFDIVKGD